MTSLLTRGRERSMEMAKGGAGAYEFGQFRLDPRRRTLTHLGASVALRPTLFEVLLYLVEHPGAVVDKTELLDSVWADRVVEESNLSQAIFWLRAALRECGDQDAEPLISTVRGRGYRFEGVVGWTTEPAPVPHMDVGAPPMGGGAANPSPTTISRRAALFAFIRRRAWQLAAITAFLIVIVGALCVWFWPTPHRLEPGTSVILADFKNHSADPVFDRTLGTVLRSDLGQSPYITVMPEKQSRELLALAKQPANAVLTTPLAEQVCVRGNADAVVDGGLDALGSRYVLTLIATNCSGREVFAEEKADVVARGAVVPTLDRLIARMRQKLGEPLASIDRFNVPIAPEKTASIDALKAYSEGLWLNDHGRRNEAVPALKRAIQLDPGFAPAFASLAVVYGGTNEDKLAADAITQAYRFRDNLNEPEKLRVETLYQQLVTQDLNATVHTLERWTSLYPNDAKAWNNLANVHNLLGQYGQGAVAGRRAVRLHPALETPYVVLARSYLRSGEPDRAQAVGALAIKQGLAGDATHGVLLAAALVKHDDAGVQLEMAWPRGAPGERILLVIEGQIAYGEGKVREGDLLFEQSAELSRQAGLPDFARAYRARLLIDLGLPDRARRLIAGYTDDEDDDFIFATAEIGDPGHAEAMLAAQIQSHPQGTLVEGDFGPEIRAALALRHGRPDDAITALRPALAYQSRTFDISYVLGRSYLAAGDGTAASGTFQRIRDHRGWYPESPLYPLAELGVARASRLMHNIAGARRAYRDFLASWKDADQDLPMLKAAKREYQALGV